MAATIAAGSDINTAKLYGNGVEESYSTSGSQVLKTITTENVTIGHSPYPGTSDRYWNGSLDDVRIYDTDLSAAQILELYNQGRR